MLLKKISQHFLPDYYFESLKEAKPEIIIQHGRKAVLIDLDNTLVPRNRAEISEEVRIWINQARNKGLALCIVSNNWEHRAKRVAEQLGLPLVASAGKPRKKAFLKALSILGIEPSQAAVVGDQLFTDVLGGNRLGLLTILIKPLSSKELFHTRLLRLVEKKILIRNRPKSQCIVADNEKRVAL